MLDIHEVHSVPCCIVMFLLRPMTYSVGYHTDGIELLDGFIEVLHIGAGPDGRAARRASCPAASLVRLMLGSQMTLSPIRAHTPCSPGTPAVTYATVSRIGRCRRPPRTHQIPFPTSVSLTV